MTELPEEAVGLRILRLLAVERGLQDEGQGNAARLFRAAALGAALRATHVHLRLGRGLEQAATEIIAELRRVGSEELAALMDQALATVSSGGWPTLAQIAPTFVCRDCGEVMLGNPPPTCPVCRARALTFHEIGPFYWELLDVDQVLPALAAGVAEVEGICAGVTEAQARRRSHRRSASRGVPTPSVGSAACQHGRPCESCRSRAPPFDLLVQDLEDRRARASIGQ